MKDDAPLMVDQNRFASMHNEDCPDTGIYVRAKRGQKWGNYDIVMLTKDSLQAWLRSRGGQNEWAESVVFILLGHST